VLPFRARRHWWVLGLLSAGGAVAVAWLCLSSALPPGAAASPGSGLTPAFYIPGMLSNNWSGYWNNVGSGVVNATASWIEPTVRCNASYYATMAVAVGIDGQGVNPSPPVQVGTIGTCIGGTLTLSGWYELSGTTKNFTTITVHAADVFYGAVNVSTNGTFQMYLADVTTGHTAKATGTDPTADRASAECVVERATHSPGNFGVLTRFTKVHFSSCTMRVNGGYSGRMGGGGSPINLTMHAATTGIRVLAIIKMFGPGSFTVYRRAGS
jgi:Peptidase A4 family